MLQSKRSVSATKLADYFGVSKRTIFRDLRALGEMNVPITYDSQSGYSLIKGYKVPPLMFTEKELATVLMGLSFMKSQPDQSMRKDADEVSLKIGSSLTSDLKHFAANLEDNTIVSPYSDNLHASTKETDWFTICKAISERQIININYVRNGDETERDIEPYFLVFYKDHWTLLSYCRLREAPRAFVLNQIEDILPKAEHFESRQNCTLDNLLFTTDAPQIEYTIQVHKDKINSFLIELPGQLLKQKASSIENYTDITFQFDHYNSDTSYILDWLGGYLGYIKIEYPQDLKDVLTDYITASLKSL